MGKLAVSINNAKNKDKYLVSVLVVVVQEKYWLKKTVVQFNNENNFEKVVHFKLEDISKIKEQIAVREINLELINKSSKSIL